MNEHKQDLDEAKQRLHDYCAAVAAGERESNPRYHLRLKETVATLERKHYAAQLTRLSSPRYAGE